MSRTTAVPPLTGNEIILASRQTITLAAGSSIQQSGQISTGQQSLTIGSATVAGSGDGTLVRVTGDSGATFTRQGVSTADTTPNLTIGAGASISGVATTLDSSNGTSIDPTAQLDQNPNVKAQSLVLSSGVISLQVDPTATVPAGSGLVLANAQLQSLATSVSDLSLSSYSSINLFGAGTIGALDGKGQPVIQSLTLLGAGIFDEGGVGTVTINAQHVTLGNPGNAVLPASTPSAVGGGTLVVNADTMRFNPGALAVDGFSSVQLSAANGMTVSGTGALNAQGAVSLATSEVAGTTAANYVFNAQGGALNLTSLASTGTATLTSGLGVSIAFDGSSVSLGSTVAAPTGTIAAVASGGGVEVTSSGKLDASGQTVAFGSAFGYTDGGTVNLTSASGNISVDAGALVNVSAPSAGGNAGTVDLSAPMGSATVAAGSLSGMAGTGGTGGSFSGTLGQAPTLSRPDHPADSGRFPDDEFRRADRFHHRRQCGWGGLEPDRHRLLQPHQRGGRHHRPQHHQRFGDNRRQHRSLCRPGSGPRRQRGAECHGSGAQRRGPGWLDRH